MEAHGDINFSAKLLGKEVCTLLSEFHFKKASEPPYKALQKPEMLHFGGLLEELKIPQ